MAQQKHAGVFNEVRVRTNVEVKIAAHAAARIDPDWPVDAFGRVACVFHGLPRAFQKLAVLRVHDRGFLWAKAKEIPVKHFEIIQFCSRRDIVRVLDAMQRLARTQKLFLGEFLNGFDTIRQIAPELLDIVGTRQMNGHTHNRNIAIGIGVTVVLGTHFCLAAQFSLCFVMSEKGFFEASLGKQLTEIHKIPIYRVSVLENKQGNWAYCFQLIHN